MRCDGTETRREVKGIKKQLSKIGNELKTEVTNFKTQMQDVGMDVKTAVTAKMDDVGADVKTAVKDVGHHVDLIRQAIQDGVLTGQ